MARRSTSDYIMSNADYAAQRDAMAEYQRTHVDPRKTYCATYVINGQQLSEKVCALSQKDAADIVKRNCDMIGWQPFQLTIKEV
jgi:hypothetical protein